MPDDSKRRGLGRGLSALMADVNPTGGSDPESRRVAISAVRRNPDQPRRTFDPDQINDLADSIREKGVLQPLIVRRDPADPDLYQIVAGERRWRAAQQAQQHDVPVIIRDLSDKEVLEIAVIENVQRVDLNPLEEAHGLQNLVSRFGHTQEEVAKVVGKSRSHVANMLRLLGLPEVVQDHLRSGQLTAGHARAVLSSEAPTALAQEIIDKGLSVREAERRAKKRTTVSGARVPAPSDADTRALQDDLAAAIKMGVRIDHRPDGSGSLSIRYKSAVELDQLCEMLSRAGLDLAAR